MTTRMFKHARARTVALLVTAAMLVGLVGTGATVASAGSSASDGASIAKKSKKKTKKCKKGYKRVKGKCKKKAKKKSTGVANPATSVTLSSIQVIGEGSMRVAGEFTTRAAYRGRKAIELTIISSNGNEIVKDTVGGSGHSPNRFSILVKFTPAPLPLMVSAKIDGVASNQLVLNP